jgi:alcohol dehydrogenase, propanol-preferring
MRAWEVTGRFGRRDRVRLVSRPEPVPGPGELLVEVEACGVCRTDLHIADGELASHRSTVVPGHEAVGTVVESGPEAVRFGAGDRVGIPWLRTTCGHCQWCTRGQENLCPGARFTGWDADGGYAELATVPEPYAYQIPSGVPARQAAPLLCAGIIGYRALRRSGLPPAGRLGLYGFGASAHLTAKVAMAQGAEVHVMTRGAQSQDLALSLGAASAQGPVARPPAPLDSAILFAPAGELVPFALEALGPGGTLVMTGIHVSDIPPLRYDRQLFHEKTLTSVTAYTRADGEEFLRLAEALAVEPVVTGYPFDAADRALEDLRQGSVTGVAVLEVN